MNTDVATTSMSSSSRVGYRWLKDNRSWDYGVNAGYDTRELNSGDGDNATVTNTRDFSCQQVAFEVEAINDQ